MLKIYLQYIVSCATLEKISGQIVCFILWNNNVMKTKNVSQNKMIGIDPKVHTDIKTYCNENKLQIKEFVENAVLWAIQKEMKKTYQPTDGGRR